MEITDKDAVLRHALRQALWTVKSGEIARATAAEDAPERESVAGVQQWVALANAMLHAGKITASEFPMYATFAVENLHTSRWMAKSYPELEIISQKMRDVELRHGLKDNEFWYLSDQPEEMNDLDKQYTTAMDKRFRDTLIEFGLHDLAQLWSDNRPEYDRLREIGRRSIFADKNYQVAVSESIKIYENEAKLCAGSGAFYSAAVMLGSAAEGRLLNAFLSHPGEATSSRAMLTGNEKPRNPDPLHWSLEHLIAAAEKIGWIGKIENEDIGVNVKPWLMSLRNTRNLLHPGKHARDKPHAFIGSEEYVDAKLGYTALCISLANNVPP